MKRIKVNFSNSEGQSLQGVIELPTNQKPSNFAVFAHCFTCNKNFHAPVEISRSLASAGYGVLRFDFTGLGESEGEFEETNFSSNVDDLLSAAEFLEKEYKAPDLLIGHSLGGAAALFAAREISSIKCVSLINSPSSLSHVQKHFESNLDEIEENGYAEVKIGLRKFRLKKQFVEDLNNNEGAKALKQIRTPLLIMHSPIDKVVSIKHAEELYSAARHPKSFVSLNEADHLLSEKEHSGYAARVIAAWASAYIESPKAVELETDHEVMANLGSEGFTTQMVAGNHHFIADEPESFGGNDFGPNPYELVSSGLAACTSMTVQMYARRKEWKLENIETHVSHSKKHVTDCENCENEQAKIDHFGREITLTGDLDQEQTDRLLEIADKCPVHRTLSSTARIITKLKQN